MINCHEAHSKNLSIDTQLGKVLRIACKYVRGKADTQEIVIQTIAQELKVQGKNVLPVIVRELGEDDYQATLNTHILEAAKQAGLDFVRCIVVDAAMQSQVEVETGEIVRINILTASDQELVNALKFVQSRKAEFSKLNLQKVAQAIVDYREKNKITSLVFLTKLKCGIGKAKLPALAETLIIA